MVLHIEFGVRQMTKVFKVTSFITAFEADGSAREIEDIETAFKERLGYLGLVEVVNIEDSDVFEWDDDLEINKTNAHPSEYQKYIKEDKFACFDCGIDLTIEDEKTRLLIKKTQYRRNHDNAYLALCRECGEKDEV